MTLQLAVVMVPVLFGMMGFAIDLGRLYLIRGELNQAANAMALAAAAQLIGTSASLDSATAAAKQSLDDTNHLGNKYNFGSLPIGQTTGNLVGTVDDPAFFATVADATGASGGTGTQADGTTARHVRIGLTADAPLLFWGTLSAGQSRKTPIAAQATAGISAPLCSGLRNRALRHRRPECQRPRELRLRRPRLRHALHLRLRVHQHGHGHRTGRFGRHRGPVRHHQPLRHRQRIARRDATVVQSGAQGLVASPDPNPTGSAVPLACAGINDAAEAIWASAVPAACNTIVGPSASVAEALCGLYSRFDNLAPPAACTNDVTDFANLSALYQPDTDLVAGTADFYTSYTGNRRRIVTIPIVNVLASSPAATMNVLGFRQFLLEPNPDGSYLNPADPFGRFVVQYIGSPAPIRQGWFDDHFGLGCPVPVASGPGKVVLHQ